MTDLVDAAGIAFIVMLIMLFIFGIYEKNRYGGEWQLHIKDIDGNYSHMVIQGYDAAEKVCEALKGEFTVQGCNNDALCEVKQSA